MMYVLVKLAEAFEPNLGIPIRVSSSSSQMLTWFKAHICSEKNLRRFSSGKSCSKGVCWSVMAWDPNERKTVEYACYEVEKI